jgi:hypothetical protein
VTSSLTPGDDRFAALVFDQTEPNLGITFLDPLDHIADAARHAKVHTSISTAIVAFFHSKRSLGTHDSVSALAILRLITSSYFTLIDPTQQRHHC